MMTYQDAAYTLFALVSRYPSQVYGVLLAYLVLVGLVSLFRPR